jgi:hypothetical protein
MSNYRTWHSKQAFHHRIMVLPFIADSNFKLKTTLYSTKNFSFLHSCISYERSPCNICTDSSTLDVTRTLGSSLFFTKNFLYSIKNFSLFIRMHFCGTSPSNICTNSSTLDVICTLWVHTLGPAFSLLVKFCCKEEFQIPNSCKSFLGDFNSIMEEKSEKVGKFAMSFYIWVFSM